MSIEERLLFELMAAEREVEAEIDRRATRPSRVRVIDLSRKFERPLGIFREGTIVTIAGPAGSRYVGELTAALERGDEFHATTLSEAVAQHETSTIGRYEGGVALDDVPAIVDVHYRTSWLAKHVILLPEAEATASYAVWSGGALDPEGFSALVHTRDPKRALEADVLVVLVPPRLSKLEAAVLEAVPGELSDIHVRGPSVAWTPVVVRIVTWAATAAAGWAAGKALDWAADKINQGAGQQDKQGPGNQQNQDQRNQNQQNQNQQNQNQQNQNQQNQNQQNQNQQNQGQQNQGQQQQAGARQQGQQQQQQQQQQQAQGQQQQQQQQGARQQQQQQQQGAQQGQQQQQQQQSGRLLQDLMRQGFDPRPFDFGAFEERVNATDFGGLDATQSVKELLRIREDMLNRGLA